MTEFACLRFVSFYLFNAPCTWHDQLGLLLQRYALIVAQVEKTLAEFLLAAPVLLVRSRCI